MLNEAPRVATRDCIVVEIDNAIYDVLQSVVAVLQCGAPAAQRERLV